MTLLEKGIQYLKEYNGIQNFFGDDFNSFRALMNITMPIDLDESFYSIQDEIIQNEYKNKKIVSLDNFPSIKKNIYLYKGDITLLKVDAIVNACNSELLGCFQPLHNCIDNAIHSYAGLQVRRDLIKVMKEQGHNEPNGKVKVTKGYNLPSKYIFHTVGPIVYSRVTNQDRSDLANCYLSCLKKADELNLETLAFPCISTGIYSFPNNEACNIACQTVKDYLAATQSNLKIIFVTFKDLDYLLYKERISGK